MSEKASGISTGLSAETPSLFFLLASWSCIGLAVGANYGTFSDVAEIAILMAVGFLVTAGFSRHLKIPGPRTAFLLTLMVCITALVLEPSWLFISPRKVATVWGLTGLALLLALTFSLTAGFERWGVLRLVLSVAPIVTACAIVVASSHPPIDVWYMYQAASRALLNGHNIYSAHWTTGRPHEVANQFTYLPASALLLAPFQWAFGDVRYGLIAALLASAFCVYRVARGPWRWLAGALILFFPDTTFATGQSWNDAGLLALICLTVLALSSGRPRMAVGSLALALAFKQYAWLLLPVAAAWRPFGWRRALSAGVLGGLLCLPWVIADPGAFWRGAVSYNLDLPARADSLSWYTLFLRHGMDPGYLVIGATTGLGLIVGILLVRRGGVFFPLAAAVVFLCFNLGNKQTFFNQWQLVAGLLVLSVSLPLATNQDFRWPRRADRLGAT